MPKGHLQGRTQDKDALLIAFTWVHNWMRLCIVLRTKL